MTPRPCHYGGVPVPVSVSVFDLRFGLTRGRVLFGVREFLPRGVEVLLNLLSARVVGAENPI